MTCSVICDILLIESTLIPNRDSGANVASIIEQVEQKSTETSQNNQLTAERPGKVIQLYKDRKGCFVLRKQTGILFS